MPQNLNVNRPAVLPRRIVLTGFMGAGKSTVGMRLARELGWTFVDLDEEIVRAEQQSVGSIFDTAGERRFRELEHLALRTVLERRDIVLAMGGGAIETAANRQLLADDTETSLLYLEAPLDVLISRCEQQQRFDPAAARRPVFEKQAELTGRFLRRKPFYESAHWTIQTAGRDPDEIVQSILIRWKNPDCRQSGKPL